MRLVLHVVGIVRRDRVDDDLLVQLHRKFVLVDGDLLDVVAAPDLDSGLRYQVLDDHISH